MSAQTDWEPAKLGDLLRVKHGHPFKSEFFSSDDGPIVLTPGNFRENGGLKFRPDKDRSYVGPFPEEFRLLPGDLLVVMTDLKQDALILGAPAFINGEHECLHNQRLGRIVEVDEERLDKRYLYYLLNTRDYREHLRATATGSTVKHTSPSRIYEHCCRLPPLSEQTRIAEVLGAYDDLIAVNRRRIALFEEMARGLFEDWFVRFRFPGHEAVAMQETTNGPLPEGWTWGVLGEVVDLRKDRTRPGDHLSSRAYVPIECIARRTLALAETRPWQEAQSSLQTFERGDILFGAMRAYFHKVCPAPMAGITRATVFVLKPREPESFSFATLLLARSETVAYAASHSAGSTIPYAQWDNSLERMTVPIPPQPLVHRFDQMVRPMLEFIMASCRTQQLLADARDLLLPRLLSGQLALSAAERRAAEASTASELVAAE